MNSFDNFQNEEEQDIFANKVSFDSIPLSEKPPTGGTDTLDSIDKEA